MLTILSKKLKTAVSPKIKISMGFDGYVDEIISAVDSREDLNKFTSIKTITQLGNRILSAAGKSTNVELFTHHMKYGGNGPILVQSIANLGCDVNYIGAVGLPELHPLFKALNSRIRWTTVENPGHTMALEFEDGKIMFGRLAMKDLDWNCLKKHCSPELLKSFFTDCDLLGMVNWTQTPHLAEIWDELLLRYLPALRTDGKFHSGKKPFLFVDLADPQKRTVDDMRRMLKQLSAFESFYRVILGLNEKESQEIASVLEIPMKDSDSAELKKRAESIRTQIKLSCCVIHPVAYAVCATEAGSFYHEGPHCSNPVITTGAGDHFNAGFCFGQVLGFSPTESLALGVSNSGYYVRSAQSATLSELANFLEAWDAKKI